MDERLEWAGEQLAIAVGGSPSIRSRFAKQSRSLRDKAGKKNPKRKATLRVGRKDYLKKRRAIKRALIQGIQIMAEKSVGQKSPSIKKKSLFSLS